MEPTLLSFFGNILKIEHMKLYQMLSMRFFLKKKKKKCLFIAFWVVLSVDLLP